MTPDHVHWLESCRLPRRSRRVRAADRILYALTVTCRWPDCGESVLYQAQALCRRHYLLTRRRLGPPSARATDGRGAPTLERVGYMGAHTRTQERYGPAAGYRCELCTARAAQWALPPSLEAETCERTGLRYSCAPEDYMPLCASCHSTLDRANPPRPGLIPLPLLVTDSGALRPVIRREPWTEGDR